MRPRPLPRVAFRRAKRRQGDERARHAHRPVIGPVNRLPTQPEGLKGPRAAAQAHRNVKGGVGLKMRIESFLGPGPIILMEGRFEIGEFGGK